MKIMRKCVVMLLALGVLASLIIVPAVAAPAPGDCSRTDAENIEFITGPEYKTLDLSVLEKIDGVGYSIAGGERDKYGIIDLDGNVLIGGKDVDVYVMSDKYMFVKTDPYSAGAVFTIDGKRVTQDLYTTIEQFYWGVWALRRSNNTVDYYTQDMKQIRVPRLPTGWEVDMVISPYLFVGGFQAQPYSRDQKLFDADGKELKFPEKLGKIYRLEQISVLDSRTLSATAMGKNGGGTYMLNEKGEILRSLPDSSRLYRTEWEEVYLVQRPNIKGLLLIDRNGNELVNLTEPGIFTDIDRYYPEERTFIVKKEEPVTLWGDDNYVVEYNIYESVYDLTGKNLTPGWYESVDYIDIEPLSFGCSHRIYIAKVSQTEYVAFNEQGKEIAHAFDGDRISAGTGDCVVLTPKGEATKILDWTGKELAVVDMRTCIFYDSGVLVVSNDDSRYSVADITGQVLSDQAYLHTSRAKVKGLVNAQRNKKWYLVNSKGEELNEIGFDAPVVFFKRNASAYGIYKMDGKYGLIRFKEIGEGIFRDVKPSAYYAAPVDWAVEQGITKGTDKVHFSPDAPCTRAQVVTFLWRANGSPKPENGKNPFSDVKPADYFYKAVLWAVEQGITKGTDSTHFSPDAACTRAQVVTFQWRSGGSTAPAGGKNPFADIPNGQWYTNAVLWAVEHGITKGTDKTHFSPDETCTRAQVVTFLYRDLAE